MYCWMVSCDMIPETLKEGDEWLEKKGFAKWAKQDFVARVSLLRHAACSLPRRTFLIEVTSMDALQKFLDSPERQDRLPDFLRYVTNVSSTILEFVTSHEKD